MTKQDKPKNLEQDYPYSARLRKRILRCRRDFHRSRGEEWANALSHLLGVVFGIVALVLLCIWSALYAGPKAIVSSAIFGATLIILYKNSMLYHALKNHRSKAIFQVFDHISIYLLIAGTYTPFALLCVQGVQGWVLFGINWGLALLGILLETVLKRWRRWSLLIYLFMGWIIIFFMKALLRNINTPALVMLVAGGISYTAGVIFYAMDRVPYMHTIWHFFVLGGSVCHWISINFFVIAH